MFRHYRTLIMATMSCLALLVSGCGSSGDATTASAISASLQRVERGAVQKYRWFLEERAQGLVQWTTKLRGQIAAGKVTRAQSRYATARVQYGQIAQAAVGFEKLNSNIDAGPGERSARPFTGFHRIEKALFAEHTTDRTDPVAKRLVADVRRLHHELKTAPLRPVAIIEGAREAMHQASTSALAGKEEPYAHIDLVDIAANVEGAEAAFEAVRPLLAYENQALAERLETAFVDAYATLQPNGSAAREPQTRATAAGSRFLLFNQLSTAQVADLAGPIDALARLLAAASGRIEAFRQAY
jgi:iron uptake system component EfeO